VDFSKLVQTLKDDGEEYFLVRPGISMMLFYSIPVGGLGKTIAAVVKEYLAFIAPAAPDKISTPSGNYKRLTAKTIDATMTSLLKLDSGDDFFEFHFGPDEDGGSEYAVHFYGTSLDDEDMPNRTNLLMLEFPPNFFDRRSPEEFVDFVAKSADRNKFHSGIAGYAFQHPLTVLREESIEAIAKLALRYRGFDTSYDDVRDDLKGHIHNVSWLNLLGAPMIKALGGVDRLRKQLPKGASILELKHGALVRVAELPIVGDVNKRAPDLKPLQEFARIVKPLRLETDYLGSDDDLFATRWLTRLD
jgi:TseV toxin immunity protein TsiV